jgi:hypothetical protein
MAIPVYPSDLNEAEWALLGPLPFPRVYQARRGPLHIAWNMFYGVSPHDTPPKKATQFAGNACGMSVGDRPGR